MSGNGEIIAGKNPVLEALRSGREMNKIWISEGVKKSGIKEVLDLARERGVFVQFVPKKKSINCQTPIIRESSLPLLHTSMRNLMIYFKWRKKEMKIHFSSF